MNTVQAKFRAKQTKYPLTNIVNIDAHKTPVQLQTKQTKDQSCINIVYLRVNKSWQHRITKYT